MNLGVLSNLHSGQNRGGGYDGHALEVAAGGGGIVRAFRSEAELASQVEELDDAGVDTIVVNGGDGTLGAVVTEVLHTWERPLPAFVPLCGGSLNSTARQVGVPLGPAPEILRQVAGRLASGPGLARHRVQTVRVNDPSQGRSRYGFVFGNGLVYEYVRYVESLGGTTAWRSLLGAAVLTGHAFLSSEVGRRAWADSAAEVCIDGGQVRFDAFKTVIACGAIFLPDLLQPFPTRRPQRDGQFVYLVNGMPRTELMRRMVPILRGRFKSAQHQTGYAKEIRVAYSGGYVLDGEMFSQCAERPLTVSAGEPVDFAWLS